MSKGVINKGIMNNDGIINNSPVVSGNNSSVSINGNVSSIKYENLGNKEDLESIKKQLNDLNLRLLDYRAALNELIATVATAEAEIKKENPNKEKVRKYLKESFSVAEQAASTMNNLLNILKMFQ